MCDDTIAVVAPKVRPGATMLELVEELEHSMRLLGSRVPSFTTHVFTSFVGARTLPRRATASPSKRETS